jgi:predicted acylesterase/phospholipase RssA
MLSTEPWRQAFDHIFGRSDVRKRLIESGIHFYLTRSNVRSGQIECTTNNLLPPQLARVSYEVLDPSGSAETFLDGVKTGVFASMDLPPLFPYVSHGDELFEDGGVIDNLPITFAASDGCDLIFILPLNADFEQEPNEVSVIARLFRVMDVRQGALERNGFKLVYLYNELASLRNYLQALPGHSSESNSAVSGPLSSALRRTNPIIRVCAVCPLKAFVQSTINTQELWKDAEAGIAFDVMQKATHKILAEFPFGSLQETIRVALVSRAGALTWDESF